MKFIASALPAILAMSAAQSATAATLIDYQPDSRISGDMTFSSPSPRAGFVAIGFTMTSASILTGASFAAFSVSGVGQPVSTPASVISQFLSIDGNKPGAILAQGVVDSLRRSEIAPSWGTPGIAHTRFSFDLPSVSLEAGSYFLALHGESRELMSLVGATTPPSFGASSARFVRTANGRGDGTWTGRAGAQVISLSGDAVGAVPEPKSWAMMLVGFGMVGAAIRYRRCRMTIVLH